MMNVSPAPEPLRPLQPEAASPSPSAVPRVFELRSADGLVLQVMDEGATWLSCRVPVAPAGPAGGPPGLREVLLGHAQPQDYRHQHAYLGAVVGRCANRIAQAAFMLDGRRVQLQPNEGPHQLHGGAGGYHRRPWQLVSHSPDSLCLQLHDADGEQGYPGSLDVRVVYRVAPPWQVHLSFEARCTAPTPVNLSSHAYFNLDGGGDVRGHRLAIAAHQYLPVRPDLIPLGALRPVAGTAFDFRAPRSIGEALAALQAAGETPPSHDHAWLLDAAAGSDAAAARAWADDEPALRLAAQLWSGDERLALRLYTSYPSLQYYAGAHLAGSSGRDGRPLLPHAGLALEPQFLPDSPNHPEWPQPACVLRPGQQLHHRVVYAFHPAAV